MTAGGSVRCADAARAMGARAAGTAPAYDGYVLVEWPLPWPRDPAEIPELAGLAEHLGRQRARLQLLVPRQDQAQGRRAIWYRLGDKASPRYERIETFLSPAAATDEVISFLDDPPASSSSDVTDVLVCAHGRRDACCGGSGTTLVTASIAAGLEASGRVRIWRTSHLGGHRFAPTALVLPEATMWASADSTLLQQVLDRTGHPSSLLARYRGTTTMPTELQVLEQHALADVGWDWLTWSREGSVTPDGTITLVGRSPRGDGQRWTGRAAVARRVPVPPCGSAPSSAVDQTEELVIRDLRSERLS